MLDQFDGAFEVRICNGSIECTNVLARNKSRPYTGLWDGDSFWDSACWRMSAELQLLQQAAHASTNQGRMMDIVVKHYGASFPDANNYYYVLWSYVIFLVSVVGANLLPTFRQGCARWFGQLAAAAQVWRESTTNLNHTVAGPKGQQVLLPPTMLRTTAGGVKVVKADDGSILQLWLVPIY